jgi:hypothetical protein
MKHIDETVRELERRLAEHAAVAIIWSIENVLEIRPDLTPAQAWEVLQEVRQDRAAGMGVNWDTLAYVAAALYGEPRLERTG